LKYSGIVDRHPYRQIYVLSIFETIVKATGVGGDMSTISRRREYRTLDIEVRAIVQLLTQSLDFFLDAAKAKCVIIQFQSRVEPNRRQHQVQANQILERRRPPRLLLQPSLISYVCG
jgi:hypothetical protein